MVKKQREIKLKLKFDSFLNYKLPTIAAAQPLWLVLDSS